MAEISQDSGGKGGKNRSKKASTKIDMTPMVDLGFLLITFFMLTTTLAKPVTMQLNMPDKNDDSKETSPVKMSETLTICPDSSKVYFYQGIPGEAGVQVETADYSDKGIRQTLFDFKKRIGANFTIVIKATKSAKYKNMVDLLDECAITDNKRYAILEIDPATESMIKKSGK